MIVYVNVITPGGRFSLPLDLTIRDHRLRLRFLARMLTASFGHDVHYHCASDSTVIPARKQPATKGTT